jgi:UDP-N-acetylmuramyl pentapeptide phosphotransferase/UDP-N-acetylglucosamine-1-phosphate transferase
MLYLTFSIVFLFSLALTAFVIPFTLNISAQKNLYDLPDSRKMHTIPTSRLGGLAFVPIIIAAFCLGIGLFSHFGIQVDMKPIEQFAYLFVGLILLYFLGLCDDLIGVQYRWKFLIQIVVACLLPCSGLWINSCGGLFGIYAIPAWIGIPISIFIVVYITNAINLIDGIDGLASGLSCISLVIIGIFSLIQHQVFFVFVIVATLGVLLPFFYFNIFGSVKHHSKLFMGDAGSLTLGYILGFFLLNFSQTNPGLELSKHDIQWIIFSSLIIPLFDVIRVLWSRYRNRQPLFLPDKNHIHHKILRTGLSVTGTLICLLLISLLYIAINYFSIHRIQITYLFLLDVALWFGIHFILNYFIEKREMKTDKIRIAPNHPVVKNQI